MRATLSYTLLRLLMFFAAAIVLALFGVHGITLLVVALVVSSLVSLPGPDVNIALGPGRRLPRQARSGY